MEEPSLGMFLRLIRKLMEFFVVKDKPNDIEFKMSDPYLPQYPNPEQTTNGTLKTAPSLNRKIAYFTFVDQKGEAIGYSSNFTKIARDSSELTANYYLRGQTEQKKFLNAVVSGNGKIEATIQTSNGEHFVYIYQARTANWKIVQKTKHPNLNDVFELVDKKRKIW